MALLDFIKNRPQQPAAATPPAQTPTPEPKKDVTKVLSPADLAKAREIGERIQKATLHARSAQDQPAAGDAGNAALLQKQSNQDKTQAALSPTDRSKGQAMTQKRASGWER
jgi:hypothetical protein